MADNYVQGTFTPCIPNHLFTDEDIAMLERFGVQQESDETHTYLYVEDGISDSEGDEDSGMVFKMLSALIARSEGTLQRLEYEEAFTCSKMRQGEFGGGACFITADSVEWFGTSGWLMKKRAELEYKPRPEPVNLAIVLDGGLVQAVVSDKPETLSHIRVSVIDRDTDSIDPSDDSLGIVEDIVDGSLSPAYIRREEIGAAGINLDAVEAFVTDAAYGSHQCAKAVTGGYPCKGCADRHLDTAEERCANEEKCLAWQYYDR